MDPGCAAGILQHRASEVGLGWSQQNPKSWGLFGQKISEARNQLSFFLEKYLTWGKNGLDYSSHLSQPIATINSYHLLETTLRPTIFSHATVLFHQSPDIPDVGARPAWICTYMAEVIINANAQVKSKLIWYIEGCLIYISCIVKRHSVSIFHKILMYEGFLKSWGTRNDPFMDFPLQTMQLLGDLHMTIRYHRSRSQPHPKTRWASHSADLLQRDPHIRPLPARFRAAWMSLSHEMPQTLAIFKCFPGPKWINMDKQR